MDSSFVYVLSKHPSSLAGSRGADIVYGGTRHAMALFPSAPESARTFPKVLEMQRAKRCPESQSLCWTMMVILVGLAGYAVALFIGKF